MSLVLVIAFSVNVFAASESNQSDAKAATLRVQRIFNEIDHFKNVKVTSSEYVLTLSGEVANQALRLRAEQIAQKIHPLYVHNAIRVTSNSRQVSQDAEQARLDEETAADLSQIFKNIGSLRNVNVSVTRRVVSLTGRVTSETARKRAESIATAMKHVIYVDNQITDVDDLSERLAPSIEKIQQLGLRFWVKIPVMLVAALIIAIFYVLSRLFSRLDFGIKSNKLLQSLVQQIIQFGFIAIGVFFALDILDATSLVGAVLGSAGIVGLAIGFAFRDIVENYLTSLLLSIRQPFEPDDLVEIAGFQGTIVKLTTSETLLMTEAGNHLRFPNSLVFKSTIINYTRNPLRRLDLVIDVGLNENLPEVQKLGIEALTKLPGVLPDPKPSALVVELAASSVRLQFMCWVDQTKNSFSRVQSVSLRTLKETFDAASIEMPYPTQTVEIVRTISRKPRSQVSPTASGLSVDEVAVNDEIGDFVDEERQKSGSTDLLSS